MIWFIFAFCCLQLTSSLECDVQYDEKYKGLVADCGHRDLDSVPTNLPTAIVVLNLIKNNITSLPVNSFFSYQNLRDLYLSYNKISVLKKGVFAALSKLVALYLDFNWFTFDTVSFPIGVFQPLKNLQYLDVHGCTSTGSGGEYPDHIFKSLVTLKDFSVDTWPDARYRNGFQNLRNLQKLSILGSYGCQLSSIHNDTFADLERLPIVSLHTLCLVTVIDAGALKPIHRLNELVFHVAYRSNLSLSKVTETLQPFHGRNMTKIDLSGLQVIHKSSIIDTNLNVKTMGHLLDICVKKLDLSNNRISMVSVSILNSKLCACVEYLDLSRNHISSEISIIWKLSMLQNLETVDLSRHSKSSKSTDILSFGSHLNVTVFCPPCLKQVLLHKGASITFLQGKVNFKDCTKLLKLDLSSIGTFGVNGSISGLSSLKYLDLSDNIIFESFFNNTDVVKTLQVLIAKRSTLKFDVMKSKPFLKMKMLRKLDLSSTGLQTIPASSLRRLYSVQSLILRGNKFDNIPDEITQMASLKELDMSENVIRQITKDLRSKMDKLAAVKGWFHLYLQGNVFVCSCATLDFIAWIQETTAMLDNKRNYSCVKDDGTMTDTVSFNNDFLHQWRKCIGQSLLTISLCVLFVVIISLITIFLIQIYFPKMEYFILKTLGYNTNEPMKRKDFDYDAYICYSNFDYQWPCHCLLKELQNLERDIRLYLPDLHELPGESKAESIIAAISASWKVVVVMSERSFRDEWFYFTVLSTVRLYSAHNDITSRIILLYRDDCPQIRAMLPPFLINVLTSENTLSIIEGDMFWRQLHRMILQEHGPDALL